MAFSFAVAALIEGRVDAAWGRWVRPWTLAAWLFLNHRHRPGGSVVGLVTELGWGGFWFWDPVEERQLHALAVIAAALLHSAIVVEKREEGGSMKSWTILLAILAFGFSAQSGRSSCARAC